VQAFGNDNCLLLALGLLKHPSVLSGAWRTSLCSSFLAAAKYAAHTLRMMLVNDCLCTKKVIPVEDVKLYFLSLSEEHSLRMLTGWYKAMRKRGISLDKVVISLASQFFAVEIHIIRAENGGSGHNNALQA